MFTGQIPLSRPGQPLQEQGLFQTSQPYARYVAIIKHDPPWTMPSGKNIPLKSDPISDYASASLSPAGNTAR